MALQEATYQKGKTMAITLHTEAVDIPAQTELVQGRHRDDFQKMVDGDVLILKHKTASADWPEPDPTKLFHIYVVGADDATAMKGVIRRAGTLHKVEPVFYKDAKTEGGHVGIKFHVARKVDSDDKVVKDDNLTDTGKPTAEFTKARRELEEARK